MNKTSSQEWSGYTASMVMFDVVGAMIRAKIALLDAEEKRAAQRSAERLHNRVESMRTLFGLYEWRYALLPVGICERRQLFYEGERAIRVTTRQLHVFGVRVARWVFESSSHRLVPEPPKARLRLRPWRKKTPRSV